MLKAIAKEGLTDIYDKVINNKRISIEDGLRLFKCKNISVLGFLANIVRERKNDNKAYYVYNQHINYSNICINLCAFCAFGKRKGDPKAYEMTIEQAVEKIKEKANEPIKEVHIVGGLHPELPYNYYLDLLRAIKSVRPELHLKAYTCVEIAHIASIGNKDIESTLKDLINAGLDSMPGGGAEVFSDRIRKKLCPKKIPGKKWIEIAKTAHKLGIRTNATMLYGHIETYEERIEHLDALRKAQDETGGFLCFIPLCFHPKNTALGKKVPYQTGGIDDLKMVAISRLMLDNFDHIKAYWIMLGPKIAQIALSFGADDFDGTIMEEKITHMAGAETAQAMTRAEIEYLIKQAGRDPVQRDSFYNMID